MAGSMNNAIFTAVPTSKKIVVIPTIRMREQTGTLSTGCRRTWK